MSEIKDLLFQRWPLINDIKHYVRICWKQLQVWRKSWPLGRWSSSNKREVELSDRDHCQKNWGCASLCCHRSVDKQSHFPIIILEAEALPLDFLTWKRCIPQTWSSWFVYHLFFWRVRAWIVLLAHSPLTLWTEAVSVSCHWSEGSGEWPTWKWHCSIMGWEVMGPARQTLDYTLPAELSLIGQMFGPVYVCSKGVRSPLKLWLQGLQHYSCFWQQLELLLWILPNR